MAAPSRAITLESPSRPCLALTYADLYGEARWPCTLETCTIRPKPRSYMPGSSRAGEPERRLEHQPVDPGELLGVELLDRRDVLDAGAVDEEVGVEVERVDRGAVGEVDLEVVAADLGGDLRRGLAVAVEHGDVGAEVGEPGGDGALRCRWRRR